MLSLVDALIDGLGNAVGFVFITGLGGIASVGVYLYTQTADNADRLGEVETELDLEGDGPTRLDRLEEGYEQQERYLLGDDADPSQPGILEELHEVKGDVQRLDEKVDEQHREVSSKLDRITDSIEEDST